MFYVINCFQRHVVSVNQGSADVDFILFTADDAESPAGGRWSRPSGKC